MFDVLFTEFRRPLVFIVAAKYRRDDIFIAHAAAICERWVVLHVVLVAVIILRVLKRALLQFRFGRRKLPITAGICWCGLGRLHLRRVDVVVAYLTSIALVKVLWKKVLVLAAGSVYSQQCAVLCCRDVFRV